MYISLSVIMLYFYISLWKEESHVTLAYFVLFTKISVSSIWQALD